MDVNGKDNELLPEDDPVAGEDQQKDHEARVGDDGPKVFCCFLQAGGLYFIGALWLFEEQQHGKKHQEHAQGGHAEYIFHAHVPVHPGGNDRSRRTADIYQCVVDGFFINKYQDNWQ